MSQENAVLLGRSQVRVFGEEVKDWFFNAADQLAINRNPDEQRGYAFGNRPQIVLGVALKGNDDDGLCPKLVLPCEISLVDKRPLPDDQNAVDVCFRKRSQPPFEGAEHRAVKANSVRRSNRPAIGLPFRIRLEGSLSHRSLQDISRLLKVPD